MQQGQVQERLVSLNNEFEAGEARLRQLEVEQTYLRETMLRISGAIQVLKEILDESGPEKQAVETGVAGSLQSHDGK